MAFAAGAESRPGRGADARFVDETVRQRARIVEAVDRAEEIERRLRLEVAHAPRGREPLAQNIARAAAALDLALQERFALGQRSDRGALR